MQQCFARGAAAESMIGIIDDVDFAAIADRADRACRIVAKI
jgi:hypothetical protein